MKLKTKLMLLGILLVNISLFAQDSFIVSGNVRTAVDNQPIPGVNVVIVNSTQGVTTDFDGNYSLAVKNGDVLMFSYVGYAAQNVIVNNQKTINIVLQEDANQLDEVVVIGYGTSKKSHLTGAISKVENKTLDQIAVARADDALIGQVSGVNIQAVNAEAGGAPAITIRGVGSITADSGPAVVVDGVIVSSDYLGNINMNDVESFEVLKDAASAAIYGSEGSNGVILITTKKGKAGRTQVNYETYSGYKQAHGSEAYEKNTVKWSEFELEDSGSISEETQYALLLVETLGVDRDWQDVFFDGGLITSHALSARGGTENTTFSSSLRYLHDEGVVITDDYKFYYGNVKVDTRFGKKVKFGISATPSYSKQRQLPTSIHNPMRQSPWLPIYHTEESLQFINRTTYPNVGVGDYFLENHLKSLDLNGDGKGVSPRTSGDSNPYSQYVEREWYEYQTDLLGSTYLSWEILDGLVATTSLGVQTEQRKRTRWDGTLHHASGASRAQYNLQNRYSSRWISDNTLSYEKDFGDHEVNAVIGVTVQQRIRENSTVTGNGYSNDLLKNLEGATAIAAFEEVNTELDKIGYFARINYGYADKYLVSASFRRDGSSVFGYDTKWGNFPAFSVGWNIARENFLKNSNVISNLKLRFSYGLTGAENFNVGSDVVNAWPYLALLQGSNAITNGNVTNGISALNIANALLQWEASEEMNPGVDFGFFNNRIAGSFEYYKRTSDELLLENPVSYVTGFSSGIVNLGEVENSGFELELRTKNIVSEKFTWNSAFIASTNENELVSFGESNGALIEDTYGRNSQWINLIGNPISSYYGYVVDKELPRSYVDKPYKRINGGVQDIIVKDLNGDGLITEEDKAILGDPYPDFIWSFTNEFRFGAFDFSFMFQGINGGQIKNIGDEYFYNWFGNPTRSGGAQQAVNDGLIPHASFVKAKVLTNEVVQSSDYWSLRNVNLGFSFPSDFNTKVGIENLRIYASGVNLFYETSSDYDGYNPEHVDTPNPRAYGEQRAGTPQYKTISLGLNVNF